MENGKLITDINPNLLVTYNKLRVGFYDKILTKGEKGNVPTLYIYIENTQENGKTIVRRKAQDRRVRNNFGDLSFIPETTAYARAYSKYLEYKNNLKPSVEELRIKELEEKLKAQEEIKEQKEDIIPLKLNLSEEIKSEEEVEKVAKKSSDKTIKEIKEELDSLNVKYNVNSTKESLLELLYNN